MNRLAIILALFVAVFAVQALALDVPPEVSISAAPGTIVNDTVLITAIAVDVMDNAGIVNMMLYEDGIITDTQLCMGATTCTISKAFSYVLPANHTYHAIAVDNSANIVTTLPLDVTFLGINTPPKWVGLPANVNVYEDSWLNVNLINLSAFAADNQTPSDNLSYTLLAESNASLVNCSVSPSRYLDCLVNAANSSGTSIVNLSVSDGQLHDTRLVTITALPVNDPPFNNLAFPVITFPEDTYDDVVNLSNYFFDIDGPAAISYSFIFTNMNVTVVVSPGTILNISSTGNYTGEFPLLIIASDSQNSTNITATINITPVNDAPWFNPPLQNRIAFLGSIFLYDINASDVDNPTVFTFSTNSTEFTIDPVTGLINHTFLAVTNYSINVTVCDDAGMPNSCVSGEFNISVIDITPPSIVALVEPPDPSIFSETANYTFWINLLDYSGVANVSLDFNRILFSGTLNVSNSLFNATIGNLAAGYYTYTWLFADIYGNANISLPQNFTVLKANSSINLTLNGTAGNITLFTGVPIEIYSSLEIPVGQPITLYQNDIPIANNNSSLNITTYYNRSFAGLVNLTATYAGNQNYTNTSITKFVDVIALNSSISLTLNGVDGNITIPSGSWVYTISNQSLPGFGVISLLQNGTEVASGETPLFVTLNYSINTEGIFNITAIYGGNENFTESEITHFVQVVDMTPPMPAGYSVNPASPVIYSPIQNYLFTSTWADNIGVSNAVFEFNGINITSSRTDNTFTATFAPLAVGNYSYKWIANDTHNNVNASPIFNYSIIAATPTLSLSISPSGTVVIGTETTVSCTASTSQVIPALIRNGTPVSNPDTSILAVGMYNYTCTAAATQNYTTPAPISSILTVIPTPATVNLLLNGTDADMIVPENSTVNITGTLVIPSSGNIDIYVNGSLVVSGASPQSVLYFFGSPGAYPILANFTGNTNYSTASETHYVFIGDNLVKYNIFPADGTFLNTSYVDMNFSTNLNSTCRWALTDLDYNSMTNTFNGVLTFHYGRVTGLEPLGLHTVYVACINDTAATNAEVTYNVSNIIENSTIDSALIDWSIIRWVNITPTTSIFDSELYYDLISNSVLNNVSCNNSIINNSVLTNCIVINSTVKDIIASNCYFANSYVDPSNLTGSNIQNSQTYNSNVTYSNVTDSTIDISSVAYSTVLDCLINGSTLINGVLLYCTVSNNSIIINTTLTNTNIINTNLTNSTANNSNLNCVNGNNVNINNNLLINGNVTICTGSVVYNISNNNTNLTDYMELPPVASFMLSPGASVYTGTNVTFTSTSTDPNIPGPLNDSLTYLWRFSDGTMSNLSATSKIYNTAGTFQFNLTVTDAFGMSNTASGTITASMYVPPSSGGGGGGGGKGSGGSGIGRVFYYNLSKGKTQMMTLGQLDSLMIEYNDVIYPLENIRIARDHANFTITGRQSRLVPSEIRKYNLNNDQYYDLILTFTKNYVTRMELKLEPTHEYAPGMNVLPLPAGLENLEPKEEPAKPVIPESKPVVQPTTPVVQPPAQQEVEIKAEIKPGLLTRLWNATKGITGSITAETGKIRFNSWLITLLVIVFGILLYYILTELFDW